jgi:hypothetical protein
LVSDPLNGRQKPFDVTHSSCSRQTRAARICHRLREHDAQDRDPADHRRRLSHRRIRISLSGSDLCLYPIWGKAIRTCAR